MGSLTLFNESIPAAQTAADSHDVVAACCSNFAPKGQEAVFLCPTMLIVLGGLMAMVRAMIHGGNSTMQVDCPSGEMTNPAAQTPEGGLPSESLTDSLDEVWRRAEEEYGLVRPEPGETIIAVHRQTSQRLAVAHETWDEIPVHFELPPEAILSDIAFGYNDIRDKWKDTTWWLCRVHDFSRSSRQPVLALTNYVLVQGDDFMMADMRPHGLIELVLGHRQVVFPTFVPRWINLPILQTFLAPLVSRTHFGITAHGSYNGDRIGNRLMLCESGFFIQLHIQATGFLLGELYSNAPLQAMTLHAVSYHPSAYDVRRSTVHIAGGYTLISSRIYERTDVHCKSILKGCIYQRFPDVVDFNFDLVKVHWSISAIEPVVNHARFHYVLAVFEEDLQDSVVVLKLDLPPYVEIGAIFVPPVLTKLRLIAQTGIDIVCGPEGELCVCYYNGHELLSGVETLTYDGDFLVCWVDDEPTLASEVEEVGSLAAFVVSEGIGSVEVNCSHAFDNTGDNRQ